MITSFVRILGATAPAAQAASPAEETKWSNSQRTKRNAYPKGPTGFLSNAQKARLSLLSRQAFEQVHGRKPESTAEADDFRHAQVAEAVGKAGLRACVQGDYLRIEAWLLDLRGEAGQAMNAHMAHETEPKRLAMAKLKAACTARGLHLGYAATICRSKYKCALDDATAPQLWKLVFDLKNRGKKKPAIDPANCPF